MQESGEIRCVFCYQNSEEERKHEFRASTAEAEVKNEDAEQSYEPTPQGRAAPGCQARTSNNHGDG